MCDVIKNPKCKVHGCHRISTNRGVCRPHYELARDVGTAIDDDVLREVARALRKYNKPKNSNVYKCSLISCTKPRYRSELCEHHYNFRKKYRKLSKKSII